MKTHTFLRWAGVLGCLAVAGCIRGPFRSAIAGDKESVAVQWTKANPMLTPLSVPAGALTDILLVPADTVALLSINCVWRPLFDNAVMSDANEGYIPAVVPSAFVIPLLAHAITLGYTWDYYVDLFGNRTEVRLKRLLAEERYSDALKLATEGSGIPTLNPTPTSGIFWAFPESEWASIANNTQKAWREQRTKQIYGLVSDKAEQWGSALRTATSPEEWDKTASKLSRLGAKLEGEVATWRALSVWREALRKQDYATALSLLKQYPSVGFDGLPMRYADCVRKGFPKTFRTELYDAGVLRFDAEDFALLLKERETGILTHAKFSLPLEAATPALNGSQEDLAAFLDATKGVAYAFDPVAAENYSAVDALVKAKQPERLVQAIAQKLVACDATTLVTLVEMGKTEEAQRLWATANEDVQNALLALALDETEPKGGQIVLALSCPTRGVWQPAFDRLCRQKNVAMRQRVAALQRAGWVSEKWVGSTRARLFSEEAKALLEGASAVTISTEIPHGEAETALLADFPEFKETFVRQKQMRIETLLANRPLKEIATVAQKGSGATALEMLKRNPSLKVVSPNDVVLGIETKDDAFAKALIQRCPNLNGAPNAVTPLMAAVWLNRTEIIDLLLSRKVNVNRNVPKERFIEWELARVRRVLESQNEDEASIQKSQRNKKFTLQWRFDFRDSVDALAVAIEIVPTPAVVRKLLKAGALCDTRPPINCPLAIALRPNGLLKESEEGLGMPMAEWSEMCGERVECALALLAAGAEANAFVWERKPMHITEKDIEEIGFAMVLGALSNPLAMMALGGDENVLLKAWEEEERELRTIVLCAVLYTDSQELVRTLVRKGAPVSLEAANAAIQKDWTSLGQWLHGKVREDCATEEDILAEELAQYTDGLPWLRTLLRELR